MSKKSASQTALLIAAYRARITEKPDALINDPWAAALSGEAGSELARSFDESFPHMELWVALRIAYLDRQLRRFVAEREMDQIVLLGAGLDTRAARMARPGLRFFEVDHPASQGDKRERLSTIDGYPLDDLTLVACDFEHDDFVERLVAAGFASDRPAVIVWEGVTPYLTEDAVRATLAGVAQGCDPRCVLMFDYLERRMVRDAELKDSAKLSRDFVGTLGEPVTFGTNDPLPLLADAGFRMVETVTFDEICLTLTGTYKRDYQFRFQHIAIASCTPPAWLTS